MGGLAVDSQRASDNGRREGRDDEVSADMPWDWKSFKGKHNHSLNKGEAKSAARQATAMVNAGVDDGIAIAVANKRINKLRKKGMISDHARSRMSHKWGKGDDDIVAPTA